MKPDLQTIVNAFPKPVPVFPLPNVVLFPGAILPLHVFEPRYREMLQDALAADRLIAIALLQPCATDEYQSNPPFHTTVCVGHVVHVRERKDGRADIAVLGIAAGRAEPVVTDKPYRMANVELMADTYEAALDHEEKLATALHAATDGKAPIDGLREQLAEYVAEDQLRPAMINTCALAAPLLPFDKLELLRERNVSRRLDQLLHFLEKPWRWN